MDREKYLHYAFAVAVVFVAGYYLVGTILLVRLPAPEKSPITDAKTGDPISKEEVAAITQRQTKEQRIYVFSGKVTEKLRDSLQIEIPSDNTSQAHSLSVEFSPKMVFLKEVPLPGFEKDSSATEEKEISLAEVNVGDIVTVVFPRGMSFREFHDARVIEINNLIVNMPQKAVSGEE